MRQYLIILFIFASTKCMGQLDTAHYRCEVFSFMDQALHDTSHYTYDMYVVDSLEFAKKRIADKDVHWELEYPKYHSDTSRSLIRIKAGDRADCFNNFILNNHGGIGYLPKGFEDQGKDLDSVYSQFARFYEQDSLFFHSFNWPTHFQGLTVVPHDTILLLSRYRRSTALKETYGADNDDMHFSIPLFNSDYTKAVFVYSYWSRRHCSFGQTLFFRKVGDRWIFIRSPSRWVS